jgi:hypothetical protein
VNRLVPCSGTGGNGLSESRLATTGFDYYTVGVLTGRRQELVFVRTQSVIAPFTGRGVGV